MNRSESGSWAMVCALSILGFGSFAGAETKKPASDKVPITTSSEEARQAYLKGRDLNEKLRATDAHKLFVEAVAKDKDFALAHLAVAQSSGTAKEFFDVARRRGGGVAKVTRRANSCSSRAPRRGREGDRPFRRRMSIEAHQMFPNDERAHNTLGGLYFGLQE